MSESNACVIEPVRMRATRWIDPACGVNTSNVSP
jgi:hypothetical protein